MISGRRVGKSGALCDRDWARLERRDSGKVPGFFLFLRRLCAVWAFSFLTNPIHAQPLQDVPRPVPVAHPGQAAVDTAVQRGIDFLLANQNKNGSWGSATQTKGLNIYAPIPGAHQAFRAAVTGLCLSALVEFESQSSAPHVAATDAIRRGEAWLKEYLPAVRRAEPEAIYNVWTHAYCIEALVDLREFGPENAQRRADLDALIRQQIERLEDYETVDGGWGYYDFRAHTRKPTGQPTSFTTAAILVALDEARDIGIEVPRTVSSRAVMCVKRQQKPDFSYFYAYRGPTSGRPMRSINRPGGSLGRSQVCNLALRLWDDPQITDEVVSVWLDRLFARNLWLDMGRKRPIPHESHFLVAGYFFYFGHFYAARCIDVLPTEEQPPHRAQLANLLLRLQEKDGSWWDFPFYDYHQQYGTAMAVMSLLHCGENAAPLAGASVAIPHGR